MKINLENINWDEKLEGLGLLSLEQSMRAFL